MFHLKKIIILNNKKENLKQRASLLYFIKSIFCGLLTVKPLYSGQHRHLKIVPVIERCPLHRGSS